MILDNFNNWFLFRSVRKKTSLIVNYENKRYPIIHMCENLNYYMFTSLRNGDIYTGDWIQGQRQGHGCLQAADGTYYKVRWTFFISYHLSTIHCIKIIISTFLFRIFRFLSYPSLYNIRYIFFLIFLINLFEETVY